MDDKAVDAGSEAADDIKTDAAVTTFPQVDETLNNVKSRAMDALVPLLDNIKDIDPERKFDICINAMRYTDNKALAEPALEAALAIKDDGPKAEALVELINEVDYLLKS